MKTLYSPFEIIFTKMSKPKCQQLSPALANSGQTGANFGSHTQSLSHYKDATHNSFPQMCFVPVCSLTNNPLPRHTLWPLCVSPKHSDWS